MINSISPPVLDSEFSSLSQSMITSHKAFQIQSLNLNLNKKSSFNSGSKYCIKPKPSTDRTHILNQSFKQFLQSTEQGSRIKDLNNSHKTDLLQKRKQYAESIRQKNRCSIKQEKSKNRKSLHNQTLNLSLSFTPPKDILHSTNEKLCKASHTKQRQSIDEFLEAQKQYYSVRKFNNQQMPSIKVFAQSNMNFRNCITLVEKQKISCSKFSKMIHNASVDSGFGNREANHNEKSNKNNKENKQNVPQPGSARKSTSQKYNSYVEIFNQKNSMNSLIQSQKSKGVKNTVSRQISSLKKDKSALKSMATPEQFSEDYTLNNSLQLDTFVNSFALEGFNQDNQEISRIQECEKQELTSIDNKSRIQEGQVEVQEINKTSEICQPGQNTKYFLKIVSQTINQVVDSSQDYQRIRKQEEKQLMLLAKQNATFKRQLANFRKENSTLRKDLQNSKNYISELQLKAKKLVEQQNQFILNQQKFIQGENNLQETNQKKIQTVRSEFINPHPSSNTFGDNLQKILLSTEQELFCLKSTNKALQLKVYMLEKKLAHQEELSKKKLAAQVHNWRDKYNKLRNQNIKLKNSLHPFNSDLSFSMQMSRDQ